MSTIQELAQRNTIECHERVCQQSIVARHILDADCCHEGNAFVLFSLPRELPGLFTVRFTAPADFTAGDTITLKGREFEPKTRMMEEPEGKVFSAGAVVQCDIDMERGLAFFTTDGEGGGAVDSVNGLTGAVTLDLPQFPGVQNALDDKADATDLAAYAPINSPAFTGTPTAPTPAASAAGNEIMTAEAVNTKLTSNLANTAPSMVRTDGVSTAGSAATVSRSDHEHGIIIPTATAATATTPGAPGSVVYAADNDTTSRDKAATPAGIMGILSGGGSGGFKIKVITASGSGTLDNSAGMALIFVVSGGQGGEAGRNQSIASYNGSAGDGGDTGIFITSLPASAPYSVNIGNGGAPSAYGAARISGGITKITLNGTAYSSLAGASSNLTRGTTSGATGSVQNGGTTSGGYSLFSSYGRGGNGGASSGAAGIAGGSGVAIILYQ